MDIATLGVNIKYDSVKQAQAALDKFSQSGEKAEKATKNLTSATDTLKQVLSGLALGAVAMQAIKVADAYTQMQSKLRLVTQSTQELLAVQSQLNKVAVATFAEQGAVTELYAKMQPALAAMGKTTQDTVAFVEKFNKALALTNPSTAQAQAAILQFSQAMGSGVLRGDEFNSMMENANGVMQKLALGMGVPIGALREMAHEGKLTADVVYAALNNATESINSDFDKMALTVGNASQTIETGMFNLVGAINNATGATSSLAEVMHDFGQVLNLAANYVDIYAQASAEAEAKTKGMSGTLDTASQSATNLHDVFRQVANVAYDVGTGIDMIVLGLGGLVATVASVGDSKQMQIVLQDTRKELDMIIKRNSEFKESLNIKSQTAQTVEGLKSIDDELKAIFGSSYEAEKSTIKFTGSNKEAEKAAKAHAKALKEQAKAQLEYKKAIQDAAYDDFAENLKRIAEHSDKQAKALEALQDELNPTIALYKKYGEQVLILDEAYKQGNLSTEEHTKLIIAAQKKLGEGLETQRKKTDDEFNLMNKAAENALKRLDDAFADVWVDIFNGAEDFGSSLQRWFTSLLAELAHAAITKPIVISITGAMGMGGASSSFAGDPMGAVSNANSAYSLWNSFGSMPVGASGSGTIAGLQSAYYAGGNLATANQAIAGAYNSGMYTQAAGTAVATYLPYAANMYGGFQKNGVAGAAVGAGQTYALSQAGAMIAGPIGAAIGSALSMVAGDSIQTGIFGGDYELKHVTAKLNAFGDAIDSSIIKIERKDGGWGNKSKTRKTELGTAELDQAMQDMYSVVYEGVAEQAKRLGFAVAENFTASVEMSVKGKSSEEIMQSFNEMFAQIGDKLVASANSLSGETITETVSKVVQVGTGWSRVNTTVTETVTRVKTLADILVPFQQQGEASYQTLSRLTAQFDAFNYPIGRLNDTLATLNMTTLGAVDSLVTMAGGMQNLQAMQSSFINAFYTDAQKAELTAQTVSSIFESIGMRAPASRESLVAMVQALDLTSEAGQRAYVSITSSSSVLDSFYSKMERQSEELARAQAQAAEELARAQAQAAEELARRNADILRERIDLENQLFKLTASENEIRQAQINSLDESNRAIQEAIYAELDRQKAAEESAQRAKAMAENAMKSAAAAAEERARKEAEFQRVTDERAETERKAAEVTRSLNDRILELTDSQSYLTAVRNRELDQLTESDRILQQRIWQLEDEAKAAEELSAQMQAIQDERLSLEERLFNMTATTQQLREKELLTIHESNRALLESIFALEDKMAADEEAARLAQEQAEENARLAQEQAEENARLAQVAQSLNDKILELTDSKAYESLVRERELAQLDESQKVLQLRIYQLLDEANAAQIAAEEAQRLADIENAINQEKLGLERQLWELTATENDLRQAQLNSLHESNRVIQEAIFAEMDRQKVIDEESRLAQAQADEQSRLAQVAQSLNDRILELTDSKAHESLIRERELALLDESQKALQLRIYQLLDEANAAELAAQEAQRLSDLENAILNERIALQDQINQLTMTESELRTIELSKIDASNRYLQERIWQLMDEKVAQEEAARAQEEAAQAAENLRNAWSDATSSIQEEINRILGIGSGNAATYQSAQSQFSQAQAMALLGDIDAAKSLPELSRTMLSLAEQQARSSEELALIKGQTAASLADTLGLLGAPYISTNSNAMQLPNAPINQTQSTNNALVAELVAIKAELAEIKAQDKQVGVQLIKQTRTTADALDKWDRDGLPEVRA